MVNNRNSPSNVNDTSIRLLLRRPRAQKEPRLNNSAVLCNLCSHKLSLGALGLHPGIWRIHRRSHRLQPWFAGFGHI